MTTLLSRLNWRFGLVALLASFIMTRSFVAGPGFTDAFYHLNAANRLAAGQGLTDSYLWTYIGAPESLPAPSHLYWMPLTSLTAAIGMTLLNAPGDYAAAQWPFALMFAGTGWIGFWLGGRLGGTSRHAWIAGLLTLFSGFFTRFWGAIDTFAPYALVGSLCLVFMALSTQATSRRHYTYLALSGLTAGLAHLTRADGLLLLMVAWVVILWPFGVGRSLRVRLLGLFVVTAAYLMTMLPWFARNISVIGSPLPLGGTQAIWFTEYDDLFNYPPVASLSTLLAEGAAFSSRWEAFRQNLGTFFAVEGLVIMTPLMLIGFWRRRHESFLRGFWLYALGLHLAMTLIFPYPGYRGGLFHSAAALVPWWAALGVAGLDDCIDWIARRRRWNAQTAKILFSAVLVTVAIFLSLFSALPNRVPPLKTPPLYDALLDTVPRDSRIMINDPAQLYYFTGLGGVVLPNEVPEIILDIARQYDVDYLLIEGVNPAGDASSAAPRPLWPLLISSPEFLSPLPLDGFPTVRLYVIRH